MEHFIESSLEAAGLEVDVTSFKAHLAGSLGVTDPSYVSLLREGDFNGILKVVWARKLFVYWRTHGVSTHGYVSVKCFIDVL
jgi:hypothetical protein